MSDKETADEVSQVLVPGAITFEQAISITAVDGVDNCFEGFAHHDWCADLGRIAHGGWCISLMFAATRRHFSTKYQHLNQPDPIISYTQYLSPVAAGPVRVIIYDVKLGARQSVVRVDVKSPKSSLTCVTAFITHNNLSTETGESIPLPAFELPDRSKCTHLSDPFFTKMNPATSRVRVYTPEGDSKWWSPQAGQNAREQWSKLQNESSRWDMLSLAFLADLVPGIPINYEKDTQTAFGKWFPRTISLQIDIRRDPEGEQWLFSRAVMRCSKNGRFDMDIKIIDERGELVADVHQVCVLVPNKTKRSGGNGDGDKKLIAPSL